jgi:4-amino-4-deoxy-L-arabinose transferase-like glycosyltransferase
MLPPPISGTGIPIVPAGVCVERRGAGNRVLLRSVYGQAVRLPGLHLLLLIAFVVRTLVAVAAYSRDTTHSPDSMTYVRPAVSLVETGRFDSYGAPELSRTPGYPLVLALGELAGGVVPVTLALQVLLNTATVVGVAVLALVMGGGTRVALLAAAIYALDPSSIIYVSKVVSETLFTAVVTVLLIALTYWVRAGGTRALVASSILLAVGCFVRPILYFAPAPLAVIVGAIAWRRHAARWRALAQAALFFIVAAAPIAAWRARNMVVAGYDRFAAITDINLLYYRAAGVIARRSGEPIDQVQVRLRREWGADSTLTASGRVARGRERAARYFGMRAQAREVLVNDPIAVALDAFAGAARTVLGRDTSGWALLFGAQSGSSGWELVKVALTVFWLPVFALAFVGLLRGGWDAYALVPALVTSAYLVAAAAGPEAYSRFRLAIVPLISVLAAGGALYIWNRLWTPQGASQPDGDLAE